MIAEKVLYKDNFSIHLFPTTKYKTTTLSLQIRADLSKETVTERALLAQVLKSATNTFPSRKEIRRYLEDLYGASFSSEVQKKGEQHVLSLKMELANEKYLRDTTPLFEKGISFLKHVLEDTYLDENGQFSEKIISEEKRTLKQRLESLYDDKIRYANKRLMEVMCKEEPYAIHPYGTLERVDKITAKELKAEYERMLAEDDIRLYVVGDINETEVEKGANIFSVSTNNNQRDVDSHSNLPKEAQEVVETDDIQQGKLHLGYRTPITFKDDRFAAMQVCNGLFGGFPHSKLFLNVREKESLAYYAASRYESHKGLILAFAGIEPSHYEKASTIIEKQLKDMQEGNFTEEEVEKTKKMLKNQLLELADSARGIIELSYQGVIGNRNRNIEQWLQEIDKVSKADVVSCAKEVYLDTRYFLHGRER